ncbi:SGNH/GDSL hydrolase family protein [Agrobacterium tumefaciens]|uniref:SGNH hydrolase-type esterase domain-containing protein n=1 Tax=Agrobacterium tumefaciens TaxID=358 RepID=A0AA44F437_AGRTU|nr:SGNH/GDSL hydrolase family protein [Agrobacterium tumefaciens]NSL20575.1 hypothetical protein [Agrobacterium tumefaciens]NTB85038.1 hypothetical protein [Agrobacterium tumefaciens]NTC15569.1 hypothetical protein [Agrobacterium tumefaciens]NTC28088.1 hypothetical protein [Agrobacterium tumefaciens]NTC54938.1 hypothetical protein [Agrobacterium tumefaciens]
MANEIRDAFRETFRDYVTEGVPSSGSHQVKKKDARNLGNVVQTQFQAAAAGNITAATWSQLVSTPGSRVGQPGQVAASDAGTHTDPVVGGTVKNSGEYRWSGTAWQRTGDIIDTVTITSKISSAEDSIARVGAIAAVRSIPEASQGLPVVVNSNPWRTARNVNANFAGWQVGVRPNRPLIPAEFVMPLIVPSDTSKLTLAIYRRPASSADGPFVGNDIIVMPEKDYSLADTGATIGQMSQVRFNIRGIAAVLDPASLYGFVVFAKDAGGNPLALVCGQGGTLPVNPQVARGYYFNIPTGTWLGPPTSSVAYELVGNEVDDVGRLKVDLANLLAATGAVETEAKTTNSLTGYYGTSAGFTRWQVGLLLSGDVRGAHISATMQGVPDTSRIRFRVYRRPVAVGDSSTGTDFNAFGTDPTDEMVLERFYRVSDLGMVVGAWTEADFDLSDLGVLSSSFIYGVDWFGIKADGTAATLGFGFNGNAVFPAEPDYRRGFYSTNGTTFAVLNDASSLAYTLSVSAFESGAGAPHRPIVPTIISPDTDEVTQSLSLTVAIRSMTVMRPSGNLSIPGTSVTFDPVVMSSLSNQATVLAAGSLTTPNLPSRHQYIGSIEVVNPGSGVVLVEGTHYSIDRNRGSLLRLNGTEDYAVLATYQGYEHRYDLIVADATTGAISVVKGTSRIIDPENYRPQVPLGKIGLYSCYVWRDGVDLMPIHRFPRQVHLDRRAEHQETLEYNRRVLAPVHARAIRQDPIIMVGYGDSITSITGGGTPDQLSPGGIFRDRVSFFARFPADTLEMIEKFDIDGMPNPAGLYMHCGWNWYIKAALEMYGSDVTYLNFGVGGSTSANSITGSTYNGLHPDRLNPVLATGAHLMVLAFGMNELSATTTYANVVNIIKQAQAAGMVVLVVTPPRRSSWIDGNYPTAWLRTHDELVRAALDTGSAVVSLHEILGYGNEGALGFSPRNMCNQNVINHPSLAEFLSIGEFVARLFR